MGKSLFVRFFFYYLLVSALLFLFFIPMFSVGLASVKNWLVAGSWAGWDFQFMWRFLRGGLIITPVASFALALNDYAKWRGWNQTPIAIISVLFIALLITGAEYARLHAWWQ